jgi:hypothetical protein
LEIIILIGARLLAGFLKRKTLNFLLILNNKIFCDIHEHYFVFFLSNEFTYVLVMTSTLNWHMRRTEKVRQLTAIKIQKSNIKKRGRNKRGELSRDEIHDFFDQ